MLPEQPGRPVHPETTEAASAQHGKEPEFVGAPREFADAAEVPEAVSLAAKILAGGLLTWSALVAIGALGVLCLACAVLGFLLLSVR